MAAASRRVGAHAAGTCPALLKVKENWRNNTVHRMQIGMWLRYAEELKAQVGTDMYFVSFNLDDYELAMELYHERGGGGP